MSPQTVKITKVFILLGMLFSLNLCAQKDSLIVFPEIEVDEERIMSDEAYKYTSSSYIDKSMIEESNSLQISSVFREIPGIFIRDYGGLGGIKTVSMRGTFANQTLFMIDGLPINSGQTGVVDISTIPISLLEGVEVFQGGASGVFGANSIGGAINLQTKESNEYTNIALQYGSFSSYGVSASKGFEIGKSNLSIGGEYYNSEGDYPFVITQFGEEIRTDRDNSGIENIVLNANFKTKFYKFDYSFTGIARSTERGVPGAAIQGVIENETAKISEKELLAINSFKYKTDNSEYYLKSIAKVNDFNYTDDFVFGKSGSIDNLYINRDVLTRIGGKNTFNELQFSYYLDAAYVDLRGDMLQPDVENEIIRKSIAGNIKGEYFRVLNENNSFSVIASSRFDGISEFEPQITPFLGVYYYNKKYDITFRANYSRNFRVPTFNELYYLNFGNTDLRPELSNSVNLGLSYKYKNLQLDVDVYNITTKDLIVSVPNSPISWSAQNFGEVLSRGIELKLNWEMIEDYLNTSYSYTYRKVLDENNRSLTYQNLIPYMPEELLNFVVRANLLYFKLYGNLNYTSFSYSSAANTYESIIEPYTLADITIQKDFNFSETKYTILFSINNILNKEYEIIRNFPMPGINFNSTIKVKI